MPKHFIPLGNHYSPETNKNDIITLSLNIHERAKGLKVKNLERKEKESALKHIKRVSSIKLQNKHDNFIKNSVSRAIIFLAIRESSKK